MTTTPRPRRWPGNLDRLSGRAPLRVKMITALLALVIVALAIISVASLTVFRNYQIQRANQQVTDLYQQEVMGLHAGRGVNPGVLPFGPYLIAIVPSGTSLAQQAARQPGLPAGTSLPYVPTSGAWYDAHGGHLINVGSVSGSDNWQVVAQQIPVVSTNFFGQAQTSNATLIVGVDLGDINGTISQLARIDLLVSAIIVVALAVVGVAIVRASMRPLADIEKTARAIAAGDLSRRVPDQDPHTEVGQLARSLNSMLAQIETSFDARTRSEAAARRSEARMRQFVADASHELRTPLTAMRGYAEYYRQRGGMQDDAAPRRTAARPGRRPRRPPPGWAATAGSAGPTWTGSCSGSSRSRPGWACWSRTCCCWPGWISSGPSSTGRWTCSRWPPTPCRTPGSSPRAGTSPSTSGPARRSWSSATRCGSARSSAT